MGSGDNKVKLRQLHAMYKEAVESQDSHLARARRDALAQYLRGGRAAGWTYTALGAVIGISGARVRQLVDLGEVVDDSPPWPQHQPTRRTRPPATSSLAASDVALLRSLQSAALSHHGANASPLAREASTRLTALLLEHRSAGVRWRELAEATGTTESAVRARCRLADT